MALSDCITVTDETGLELKQHGNVIFPVACYWDDLCANTVPWHWHDELEVAVVTEGRAFVATDNGKAVLQKGEGFFINTGVVHGVWNTNDSECRLHSMCFHARLIGGGSDSIFWQKYLRPLMNDNTFAFVRLNPQNEWERKAVVLIEEAWQKCKDEPEGYEFDVRNALSQFISLLISNNSLVTVPHSDKTRRNQERIKKMLSFIQKNYGNEIKVKDIANSATISESECLRCFQATIGATPIQYVKQFRIQKAAELLMSSDCMISEIGEQCGFYDMSYFSKEFRKIYSCTPSQYRNSRYQIL